MKLFLCVLIQICVLLNLVMTEVDAVVALAGLWLLNKKKMKQKKKIKSNRRSWVSLVNQSRHTNGEYHYLMADLRKTAGTENDEFFKYFRMKEEKFEELHERLKVQLTKKQTNFRPTIKSEERLALTLRCVHCLIQFSSVQFSCLCCLQMHCMCSHKGS